MFFVCSPHFHTYEECSRRETVFKQEWGWTQQSILEKKVAHYMHHKIILYPVVLRMKNEQGARTATADERIQILQALSNHDHALKDYFS
jgi:hypothetical protein